MNENNLWPTILICLLLLIPGCLEDSSDETWYDYNGFHYQVKLSTISNDSFMIYLPVTIASRNSSPLYGGPNAMMSELEIVSGMIEYNLEFQSVGFILNVTGEGSFKLQLLKYIDLSETDEELDRDYQFDELSTDDRGNGQMKIFFFTTSNDTFRLSYYIYNHRDHSYGGHRSLWKTANYILSNGWNNITDHREDLNWSEPLL